MYRSHNAVILVSSINPGTDILAEDIASQPGQRVCRERLGGSAEMGAFRGINTRETNRYLEGLVR